MDLELKCGVCGASLYHREGAKYVECPLHIAVPRMVAALQACLGVLERARDAKQVSGKEVDEAIAAARDLLASTGFMDADFVGAGARLHAAIPSMAYLST